MQDNPITEEFLKELKIQIYEPLAEYLGGTDAEVRFALTLLDIVRLSGHACPSIGSAFLLSRAAVRALYPETQVCIRGDVEIEMPSAADEKAFGPISIVFGYVFGAWPETGFGGLNGEFRRRHLLRFQSERVPDGFTRFSSRTTGRAAVLSVQHDYASLQVSTERQSDFQFLWRSRVRHLLDSGEKSVVPASEDR